MGHCCIRRVLFWVISDIYFPIRKEKLMKIKHIVKTTIMLRQNPQKKYAKYTKTRTRSNIFRKNAQDCSHSASSPQNIGKTNENETHCKKKKSTQYARHAGTAATAIFWEKTHGAAARVAQTRFGVITIIFFRYNII